MARRSRPAAERAAQAERLRSRPARGRILAAAGELAEAKGYESLSVGELARAAGVSRETFYTHFAGKRACLAEATAPELGQIDALLSLATERGSPWAAPLAEALEHALGDCHSSAQTPRGRILQAIVEVAAERGFAATRIADVIGAAHVSHQLFYRHFEGRESCFEAALQALCERLRRRVEAQLDPQAQAAERLAALAGLLAAEPQSARVLLLEAPQLRRWRHGAPASPLAELAGELIATHTEGEGEGAGAGSPASLHAAAVLEVFAAALRAGELEQLPARAGELARLLAPASGAASRRRGGPPRRPQPGSRRPARRLAAAAG